MKTTDTAAPVGAPTKSALCAMLRAFINQRPGLDYANYGDPVSYRAEIRHITRQRADALQLLRAVELRDSITVDDMREAFPRAFSGRLEYRDGALHYTAGQYFPTEYRAAAAAVLASVLWAYMRANMPAPVVKRETVDGHEYDHEYFDGLRAGPWLRRHFRQEFGRGIASRWFN